MKSLICNLDTDTSYSLSLLKSMDLLINQLDVRSDPSDHQSRVLEAIDLSHLSQIIVSWKIEVSFP
jgi:hypothetical protein